MTALAVLDEAARLRSIVPELVDPEPARVDATIGETRAEHLAEFQHLARGWSLRDPVNDTRGLIECRGGIGGCLAPLLPPGGRRAWIDPRVRARDGDLVLVEFSAAWRDRIAAGSTPREKSAA